MDDRFDQIAAEEFARRKRLAERMSVSYMSNAKWKKALVNLAETNAGDVCEWKLVFEKEVVPGWIPALSEIHGTYVDSDCYRGGYGVVPTFEDFEWLELLAERSWQSYENAPESMLPQDTSCALEGLRSLGILKTEKTSRGLRLYGYERLDAV